VISSIRKWWARKSLFAEADKAAIALDIMLSDYQWYGGVITVASQKPHIEVLVIDDFPGKLSDWIPPRIGVIPVLVRFGQKA
jgi:hypothetical protein